jgi:hypothetical protein
MEKDTLKQNGKDRKLTFYFLKILYRLKSTCLKVNNNLLL